MKKLFTLVALLACFLGAKAEWVQDKKVDFSTFTGFPHYVMGYVPEWVDGVMTDYGADYRYATQDVLDNGDSDGKGKLADGESSVGTVKTQNGTEYQKVTGAGPYWHQYHLSGNFQTELDGSYTVKAMVKASAACTIDVDLAWGWKGDQSLNAKVNIGTEWEEVEWTYNNVGGTECWVTAKPGTCVATIEWKYVIVGHNAKAQASTVWQEWLTNDGKPIVPGVATESIYMGNAETDWPEWATKGNPNENWKGDKTGLICAWGKTKGRNQGPVFNPTGENEGKTGFNPFPADITTDPDDPNNKVFVVHGAVADTEGDPSAWDNQFWIQSPKSWKSGEQLKIHFRYKCSKASVKTQTQIHKQNPSEYLIYHAIGDVTFTNQWQTFDGTMTMQDDMDGGWSIAFNLNAEDKDAIDFYFDDLQWMSMVLEEGYFVAGSNSKAGLEYDFANAIKFEQIPETNIYSATIGEAGKKDTYVSEIMISTVRGNDASFKANTLKPNGTIASDEDTWLDYTPASVAKLKLPMAGVWSIYIDTAFKAMVFVCEEGEEVVYDDVVTNSTAIVVHGKDREDLKDEWDKNNSKVNVREDADPLTNDKDEHGLGGEGHEGQTWDNQFFIKANRALAKGEVTKLVFKYKSSVAAKTTTQCHGNPGGYMHWAAIGDVNFTTDWQNFEQDFTVPNEADGMQCIAFNMAEIKKACDYEITDVQWYIYDSGIAAGKTTENLIDATGTKNFYVKEGAGTTPYQFGTVPSGIENVNAKKAKTSTAIYNLAGQRVDNGFKGIVIKDGKKFVK